MLFKPSSIVNRLYNTTVTTRIKPLYNLSKYDMSTSSSIIPINRLKQTISNRSHIPVGTFLAESKQTCTVQILANSGFDYFTIDNEHGQYTTSQISELSRYAVLAGITPIVRIPDHQYHHIAQSLDAGCQGLMLPRINNAQQLKQLISYAKFPPTGVRGNALGRSYTMFRGSANVQQAMNDSNQQTLIIAQIETKEAIDNIHDIVRVEGVDVLLIGPNDLSIALGVAGDIQSTTTQQAIQHVIDACNQTNGKIIPAIHQNSIELSQYWKNKGMKFLSISGDSGLLATAATNAVNALRK